MELIFLVVAGWGIVWLWTLYDAAKRSEAEWQIVGESRTLWLLLILVLQFFGTLFYLVSVRPKLEGARRNPAG